MRASQNPIFKKIQNKYFYSVPYSNETLYMKALEYKTYFIHIDSEQIVKSLEDIQIFCRYEIQNVWPSGEYKIYYCFVCVMF